MQIHLLDPWWNPATEDQAMDRVHRIGQQRAVSVWRYVSTDSIEERMLVLQVRTRCRSVAAGRCCSRAVVNVCPCVHGCCVPFWRSVTVGGLVMSASLVRRMR